MKTYKEGIPLSFYYWIHSKISKQTFKEHITKEKLMLVLRQHYNIEKSICPLIIKELEMINLIEKKELKVYNLNKTYYKVKCSKPTEEIIFEKKKELNLL